MLAGLQLLTGRDNPNTYPFTVPAIASLTTLTLSPSRITFFTGENGSGAIIAVDPNTGQQKWQFKMTDVTGSGILTTASDVIFTGGREGFFYALDARNGTMLWKAALGGQVAMGPVTYRIDGKQHVAVAAGHALFTFALRP